MSARGDLVGGVRVRSAGDFAVGPAVKVNLENVESESTAVRW